MAKTNDATSILNGVYTAAEKHIRAAIANAKDEKDLLSAVRECLKIQTIRIREQHAKFVGGLVPTMPTARQRVVGGGTIQRTVKQPVFIELNSALSKASDGLMSRLKSVLAPYKETPAHFYEIRHKVLETMRQDGMLNVRYNSHAGKKNWRVSLESYASMVTRSARTESDNISMEQRAKDEDTDYVYMPAAQNACPLCMSKGDRVYCISGKDPRFPKVHGDLYNGEYSTIHPNCRCRVVPWHEEQHSDEMKKILERSNRPKDAKLTHREEAWAKNYAEYESYKRKIYKEYMQYQRYKAQYKEFPYNTLAGYRRAKRGNSEELKKWISTHSEKKTR